MGITHYLAMTAAEFRCCGTLPHAAAWMACHFSPYGLGLSNLPQTLPPDSLLILDDITPIRGHDPDLVGQQLSRQAEVLKCSGVLLDFQRPDYPESAALAAHLARTLPCPVGVSELYAAGIHCPVFLPPLPCHVSPEDYFTPWQGREIWLETSLEGEIFTITEEGARLAPLLSPVPEEGFSQPSLCCHYRTALSEDEMTVTLWRTEEDLRSLLDQGEAWGITRAVGLYQEHIRT